MSSVVVACSDGVSSVGILHVLLIQVLVDSIDNNCIIKPGDT